MKILVLLSGGLDSATCLGLAVEEVGAENVSALCSYYGQKHSKEIECARKVAAHYGVKLIEMNLESVMKFSNCSLLTHSTQKIKHGDYAEQTKEAGGKPVETYVPFRNGLFLSVAASIGLSIGAQEIWYGAHADDAAGSAYPDCSLEFVENMRQAIETGSGGGITIRAPFVNVNKAAVVKKGLWLKVPYELTWSCYEGGEKPCGKCGTCIDRAKAFAENGVVDPYDKT